MDPRHTLYRTFETLTVDPENLGKMSAQDAATAPASSGVTPEGIEKKLKEGLGAVYVEIADLSGMYACRSAFPIMSFFLFVVTHSGCFFLFDSSAASTPRHRHWPRTLQLREWRMMHMQNMYTAI
jgi:hypothetical protein